MPKIHSSLFTDSSTLSIYTLIDADYETTHADMLSRTLERIEKKKQGIVTPDELWVVEHNDVYTLGQAGKEEHILMRGNTPIIHTDRGGQVTWHGRGQLVVYWLFDLNNLGWTVRNLVSHAEQSIEDVLNAYLHNQMNADDKNQSKPQYYAKSRQDAPGVYIYNNDGLMLGKMASLGFKIKHGFSYHGVAINLNCDLSAFNAINPCGYEGMQMLRLADFVELDKTLKSDSLADNHALDDALNNTLNGALNSTLNNADAGNLSNSVASLKFTEQLIENIKQRQVGEIDLRDNPSKKSTNKTTNKTAKSS